VSGSLTVVGIGITVGAHLTPESRSAITGADELHYLAADPVGSAWLAGLHADARPLDDLYESGRSRGDIYDAMTDRLVARVREGCRVCAAFYGHPGVFVRPSHDAVRRVRAEGLPARLLPAVSAEDCLFADLGIDPAADGCQSYDATDFLVYRRRIDYTAGLILWQVSFVGATRYDGHARNEHLPLLAEALLTHYPDTHEVVLYEASPYPAAEPIIERLPLGRLATAAPTPMATLYVPPVGPPRVNRQMLRRLGLAES
jgi:uncharacterized protein YabN with tetrapyrrole methylase and pyrophosphatase domain